MTENTDSRPADEAQSNENAPGVGEVTPDNPEPAQDGSEPKNREARYRTQLREVEGERDTLRKRVDDLLAVQAQHHVGERLHDPADLFRFVTVADVLDDEGNVDAGKVDAAVLSLGKERPHLLRKPAPDMSLGASGNATPAPDNGSQWQSLLRGKN